MNAFVGALANVRRAIEQVAPTDATVLLLGETGTGKELVARAVHASSRRARGAFVPVSGAALVPTLAAGELFGHEVGAFTGAVKRRAGRFEQAAGGTLFLDEVGELATDVQAMLLRVLQERVVERLGGGEPVAVDVRLIAATNRDLAADVRSGTFRADLFYRSTSSRSPFRRCATARATSRYWPTTSSPTSRGSTASPRRIFPPAPCGCSPRTTGRATSANSKT